MYIYVVSTVGLMRSWVFLSVGFRAWRISTTVLFVVGDVQVCSGLFALCFPYGDL
jgi:hypothetical protein